MKTTGNKGNERMKNTSVILKALCVLSLFSGLTAVSKGEGYAQDAAAVARIMRAVQTRHVYLHHIYSGTDDYYIQWPSIACGSLQTPPFPTDNWYSDEFKTDPQKVLSVTRAAIGGLGCLLWIYHSGYCWFSPFIEKDLDGESSLTDVPRYDSGDFPELFVWGGEAIYVDMDPASPNYYRLAFEHLNEAVNKLKRIQVKELKFVDRAYRSGGGHSGFGWEIEYGLEYAMGGASSHCAHIPNHVEPWNGKYGCGWRCRSTAECYPYHVDGGWIVPAWSSTIGAPGTDVLVWGGWSGFGVVLSTSSDPYNNIPFNELHVENDICTAWTQCCNYYLCTWLAYKEATRAKIEADLTNYTGGVKIYMALKLSPSGDNIEYIDLPHNMGGFAMEHMIWRNKMTLKTGGVTKTNSYFCDFEPQFNFSNLDRGLAQSESWCLSNIIGVNNPAFQEATSTGISPGGEIPFEVYKKGNGSWKVYSASQKCPEKTGETVKGKAFCPQDMIPGSSDKLAAKVYLTKSYNTEFGKLSIAGQELTQEGQVICVPFNPASPPFEVGFSVQGLKGGPTEIQFNVDFWKQTGTYPNLQTTKSSKSFTFNVLENHYSCCAKEDKCGADGCYGDPFPFPKIEKFKNRDMEVYFPDAKESYITFTEGGIDTIKINTVTCGFIHDVGLEGYHSGYASTSLAIKNPDGTTRETFNGNAVVLRDMGGLGYVYVVPSSWWTSAPTGIGEPKYLVDESNTALLVVTENGTTTIVSSLDGNIYTEYKREDVDNPDRITSYIEHDHTSSAHGSQCREHILTYDAQGRITQIGNGGAGCQSCGANSNKIYDYDEQGNVLQEKDASEVVLYEYDYDTQNRMIMQWLGEKSEGNLVEEVFYTDTPEGTTIERHKYLDDTNYTVEVEFQDKAGSTTQATRFENLNDNPDSPDGKYFIERHSVWPPIDMEPSLQGYWKMNDEEGGWAMDSSIYKRDGILKNYYDSISMWSNGRLNGGLKFNYDYSYQQNHIRAGYKGVCGSQSRTVLTWVKTAASTSEQCIVHWGSQTSGQKWDVKINSGGRLVLDIQGTPITETTINLRDDAWHHIAISYDNAVPSPQHNVVFYVDGQAKQGVRLDVQTSSADDVIIGAAFDGSVYSCFFNGVMDEVMIFDKALTAAQIDQLCAYQKRDLTGTYTETEMTIPPQGKSDGTGRRHETVRTYTKATDGTWYVSQDTQKEYSSAATPQMIVQSVSVYQPVYQDSKFLTTRLLSSTSQGATTTYAYDDPSQTRIRIETLPAVNQGISGTIQLKRWYDYDNQGRMKEEREFTGTDPAVYIIARHYEYDSQGNMFKQYQTEVAHPAVQFQVVEYKYNGFKQEICSKSAEGVISGKEYDNTGKTKSEFVFANPADWSLSASQYAAKLNVSLPEVDRLQVLSLTRYYYNAEGQLEFVRKAKAKDVFAYCDELTAPAGVTWVVVEYRYDDYGRQTQMLQYVDGRVLTTEYQFNRQGQQERTILPNKKYSKTIKDGRDIVKEEIIGYMDGSNQEVPMSITRYKYGNSGNLKEQIYPDGTRLENIYDEFDRIKKSYKGLVPLP